jgi:hypothetical protein
MFNYVPIDYSVWRRDANGTLYVEIGCNICLMFNYAPDGFPLTPM